MYPSSPAQKASAHGRAVAVRSKARRPGRIDAQRRQALICAVEQLETRILMASGPTLQPILPKLPSIQFMQATTSSTGITPAPVDSPLVEATGVFTPNGLADVVTGGTGGIIEVWLSNGKGGFNANGPANTANASAVVLSTGASGVVVALAVADLTGDGREDIVAVTSPNSVTAHGVGAVTVFLGNGNGTFKPRVLYANIGEDPDSVVVGDFNGFPDIVVASRYSESLTELVGNGSGSFENITTVNGKTVTTYVEQSIPVESEPIAMAVGIIPARDGTVSTNLDLVVLNGGNGTISVLYGNGDGTFQPQFVSTAGVFAPVPEPQPPKAQKPNYIGSGVDMQIMNLDPYSVAPAVVLGVGDTITVLYGNSDGTFQAPVSTTTLYAFSDETITKVEGDGFDLVAADGTYYARNATVSITPIYGTAPSYGSAGTVTLGQPQVFPVGSAPSGVVVADVNGDGHPDLVTGNYGLSVTAVLGNGGALFQAQQLFPVSENPIAPIITTNVPANSPANVPSTAPTTSSGIVIGDFNNDGNPDVAITTPGASTTVVTTITGGTITTTSYSPGSVSVFLGNGDGTFQTAENIPVGISPTAITVGNFNGEPDIVVANGGPVVVVTTKIGNTTTISRTYGHTVTILLGDGSGNFTSEVYTVGTRPTGMAVGDVNGDGNEDLVVASPGPATAISGGSITVLLGDGMGHFATHNYVAGNNPDAVTIGDFTGDGLNDIAVADSTDLTVEILFGQPGGGFALSTAQPVIVLPTSDPTVLASGDLTDPNGTNGIQDIVVGSSSGAITILRGNGDGTFYVQQVYDIGPAAGSQTLTLDDINGEGYPDIVYGSGSTVETLFNTSPVVQAEIAQNVPGISKLQLAIFESGSSVVLTGGTNGTFAVGSILAADDPRNDGLPDLVMPSANSGHATFTDALSLAVPAVPQITTVATSTIFAANQPGTFTFAATGSPTPTFVETGALPAGVAFVDNKDGTATLEGTPTATSGGTYILTIGVGNTQGTAAAEKFTLTVGQAPAITSNSSASIVAGTSTPISIISTGFPKAAISETGALPAGLTFKNDGDGTALISGTAVAGAAGTYVLDIDASNGISPNADQMFTLTVVQLPSLSGPTSATFSAGSASSVTISSTSVPVAALTESGALPPGITFTDNGNGTASLGGTAATGSGGSYVLTITAANGTLPNASETFTLSVKQAPTITGANSATFTTGSVGTFLIGSTGFPAPGLSETGLLPAGVSFHNNGDGTATISGTPDSSVGNSTYTITINASNDIAPNASETYTIAVNASATIRSVGGVVYVTGTNGPDTGYVLVSGGNLVVVIDQLSASYPLSSVTGINVALLQGNDSFTVRNGVPAASVNGGGGNDTLVANNNAPDTLSGAAGNDSIRGGGGNQSLLGDAGNDTLSAGVGNQTLLGGDGADSLVGGNGMDVLSGGTGPDTLISGGANSSLYGGSGHDSIISGSGFALLDGGLGTDTIVAGGTDTITDTTPGSMIFQ